MYIYVYIQLDRYYISHTNINDSNIHLFYVKNIVTLRRGNVNMYV